MKLVIIILIFITYFVLWCMLKAASIADRDMEKMMEKDK